MERKYWLVLFVITFIIIIGLIYFMNDTKKLERDDLPIEISDETWEIFEEVQKVAPIELEIDPTWKNNTVSKNVKVQIVREPRQYEFKIIVYDREKLTEELIAHELLHAQLMKKGIPVFIRRNFQEIKTIDNLENSIQHFYIYENLENRGFFPKAESQKEWEDYLRLRKEELLINPPPENIPIKVFKIMGAVDTFDALVKGIEPDEIKKNIHPQLKEGFEKGLKIFGVIRGYNLTEVNESLQFHLQTASILNLTMNQDISIVKIDFNNKKVFYRTPFGWEEAL